MSNTIKPSIVRDYKFLTLKQYESLRAKVAELEEASVTQKAYYESVFQDGAKRIADENAFFNFVLEQGDLDFFERRIKATHIKEWSVANEGKVPPGLNIFRELTMKVRRS